MDLNEFSRQIELMQARLMRLSPPNGAAGGGVHPAWEETSEAIGVTMEEMRVAEEELYHQNRELQESRRAIEQERQRYRDLFDFAPDGYLVTDLVGVIREANRAAGDLLGVVPNYLMGKPLAAYLVLDERPAFRLGMRRLLQVGRRDDWVIRLQPRRGGPYNASVTAAVVRDEDGTPTALRWLIREVLSPGMAGRASGPVGRVTIGMTSPTADSDELAAERAGPAAAPRPRPRPFAGCCTAST